MFMRMYQTSKWFRLLLVFGFVFCAAGVLPARAMRPAEDSSAAPELAGTTWRWAEFVNPASEVMVVPNSPLYTITFERGNRVSGQSDCSPYTGTYRQNEYELFIGRLSQTRDDCGEDSVSQAFETGLLATRSFTKSQDGIVFVLTANAGEMRFVQTQTAPLPEPTPSPEAPPNNPILPSALAGKTWKWQQYIGYNDMKIVVADPGNYILRFNPDGTLSIGADCANTTGSFLAADSVLRINEIKEDSVNCPTPSLANTFLRQLSFASGYTAQDQQLVVSLAMEYGQMVFTSGEPMPQKAETHLPAILWKWDGTASPAGKITAPKDSSLYTLVFNANGTFTYRADCNKGQGRYVAQGDQLDVSVGSVSSGRCGRNTLSQNFARYVDDVTGYAVMGDHLYLDVKYNSGVMMFSKDGTKPAQNKLMGQTWKWRSFTGAESARLNNLKPANYTLRFLPGGRLVVSADCFRGQGRYVLNGDSLSLQLQSPVQIFCGDASYADDFARWLDDVESWRLDKNSLTLNLKFDSGSLAFSR